MLYRAFLVLVAAFWAVMWALLIRSEVQPGGASVRTLPVEHVLKEMFRGERYSTLKITDGTTRVGSLRLAPKGSEPDGTRMVDFAGNFSLTVPGGNRQRISWDGKLVLGANWELDSFRIGTVTRDISPPAATATPAQIHAFAGKEPLRLDLLVEPRSQRASYKVRLGDAVIDQQDFRLDEGGLEALMDHLGVDSTWRQQMRPGQAARPQITARQASLIIKGVKMETYLLTVTLNQQTLLSIHVSQIGEVLQAESLVGWSLEQE